MGTMPRSKLSIVFKNNMNNYLNVYRMKTEGIVNPDTMDTKLRDTLCTVTERALEEHTKENNAIRKLPFGV
jgi:hypothetical protein